MKLKRSELVSLNMLLIDIVNNKDKEKYDKRFIFGVHRNIENFEPEINAIRETQKEPDGIQEFQDKLQQIGKECADRDEKGNPKLIKRGINEVFDINEKQEEARERTEKLKEEYKEVVKQHQENIRQFNELMNEEIEIDVCKISFNYFPDKYDINDHMILKHLIKETDEEIEAML